MTNDIGPRAKFVDLEKELAAAAAARLCNDPAQALSILDRLRGVFPDNPLPILPLRARFPGDKRVEQRIFEARVRLEEMDTEAAELSDTRNAPAAADAATMRELARQFESPEGAGHDCE